MVWKLETNPIKMRSIRMLNVIVTNVRNAEGFFDRRKRVTFVMAIV